MPTLTWIGKTAVADYHEKISFQILSRSQSLSIGTPHSGNLLIHGDNLLSLKALLPYYKQRIKCVYIDPPYNTGNEKWVYNDAVNSPDIRAWLGKTVGGELDDLSRHDKWLCMMYPRLKLLKQLLRDDGVLMVSIDDNEYANLKLLLADVFGEPNIIATLVWQKAKKGDSKLVSVTHEYIVMVARNKARLKELKTKWRLRKPGIDKVLEHYESLRSEHLPDHATIRAEMMAWYRALPEDDPARNHKHYNWSDDRGLYFAADFSGPDDGRANRPRYDIPHPVTGKPCKVPSTGWRWDPETTRLALLEVPPRIHFGATESTIPNRKSYLVEVTGEPLHSVFYKDGRAATLELEEIVGPGVFPFPKDSDVLADLFGMICEDGDYVLDSFAGSGTTGQAVMKVAQRGSKRLRFILVELEKDIAIDAARKRLEAAGAALRANYQDQELTVSLDYCTLGQPLLNKDGEISPDISYDELARHVFFTETGQPLSLRFKVKDKPLIGTHGSAAFYLLYDDSPAIVRKPTTLTSADLAMLPPHDGPKVIFADACSVGAVRLKRNNITFKQIPYRIKVN